MAAPKIEEAISRLNKRIIDEVFLTIQNDREVITSFIRHTFIRY